MDSGRRFQKVMDLAKKVETADWRIVPGSEELGVAVDYTARLNDEFSFFVGKSRDGEEDRYFFWVMDSEEQMLEDYNFSDREGVQELHDSITRRLKRKRNGATKRLDNYLFGSD